MTTNKLVFATTTLILVILFLLAEIGLRIYQRVASDIPVTSFLPGYKEKRFALSPFLVFGPRIDWQIPNKKNPQHAYFNSQGFRTRDLIGPKPKGEHRIITLGGSTSEDVWNEEGIHWPLVLEQRLHDQGHTNIRVLNSAMSAYTTAHSLIRFAFDITEYTPDMVIIMHNINDLMVNYQATARGLPVDPHYNVLYSTKRFTGDITDEDIVLSRVAHAISSRFKAWRETQDRPLVADSDISLGKRYFKRNLSNLVILARAHNVEIVLLTMPYARSEVSYEKARANGRPFPVHAHLLEDLAAYNEAIKEVGKRLGVTVIDMATLLGDKEEYFVDIVHFSTRGVESFGHTLAPRLAALLGKSPARKGVMTKPSDA